MRTAVLTCCCLALAACTTVPAFKPDTSVTTPAVGHPAPPSSVPAATGSEAFTPYANLGRADNDSLAPGESFSALSKACLTDAGYPDADGAYGIVIAYGGLGLDGSAPWGPWGYLGVADAAQYGFSPGLLLAGSGAPVQPRSPGSPSTAEQNAMSKCGTITGKFNQSQLSGPLAGISTLTNDIATDIQHDPAVRTATKAWSACMAQNGYTITDPQTAFIRAIQAGGGGAVIFSGGTGGNGNGGSVGSGSVGSAGSGSSQTKAQKEAEVALAVTDADCTESSDLAGIYFAVQASYEQQLVNANQQALAAAVVEYRTAYQKELSQLPKLLKSTKALP